MTQARTLLAATDFSTPARHALRRAELLAEAHADSRLVLAHVLSRNALDGLRRLLSNDAAALEATLFEHEQRMLSEAATQLAAKVARPVDSLLRSGSVPSTLVEIADEQRAALLVMGARGQHFVREHLLGSTTERVLRIARHPVLVVKQHPHAPYQRILAAVDFSDHAAAAIDAAHAWLPTADIVLLNAFEVEIENILHLAGVDDSAINQYRIQARDAAQEAMEAFIDRLQVPRGRLSRLLVHGPATLRILEQEQVIDPDLIVMGKHGQSALEELLLGSVTQHVLAYSSSDVLVVGQAI